MAGFDAYHQWLGIPPGEQPPNHYRLLGVPLLESDPDVIEAAAQRQTVFLRTLQLGPQAELAERLLNEVARARVTLLNTDQKTEYDNKLPQSQPLPADPVPDSDREALSAEIATLRKAIEQRDQPLRQGKEDLEQERAELAHHQQRLARGVAALKKEQELQRAQPLRRRLPPARSAGFKSLRSPLTDWILSNVVKIAMVVILVGFLFLALFSVSSLLKKPELNVANDLTGEQSEGAEDPSAKDEIDTVSTSSGLQSTDQAENLTSNESADTSTTTKEHVGTVTPPPGDTSGPPEKAIAPFTKEQAEEHQRAWAKYLDTEVFMSDDRWIEFVLIPPGRFTMWSPESEAGRGGGGETEITEPFYLSVHEVTRHQYELVMNQSPWKDNSSVEGDDYPATFVSWDKAMVFCQKQSTASVEYRLPTEAQWEYACRAGTKTSYSSGSSSSELDVGGKDRNPWGLRDMYGKVWEWCQDAEEQSRSRVLRGGAFNSRPQEVLPGSRQRVARRDETVDDFGFRVTRTIPLSP